MKFVLFYHSLRSDWNHGNAHFLRGIATELIARGHQLAILEPRDGWSSRHLRAEQGTAAFEQFHAAYPQLSSELYDPAAVDLDAVLEGADVVIVHEWNEPALVQAIGRHRAAGHGYRLLFHDTHHRAVSAPHELAAYDLSSYDGVLAFGEVLREIYARRGWGPQAFTWHEAADTRVFRPPALPEEPHWDLVWIGNWGDGEREREIVEFLVEPAQALGLATLIHGVRYPPHALERLGRAGIRYGGWIANFRAPEVFARARATVHVPRRFYREQLPGIPTIRVFEALACGIPLVSAPWDDAEGLFGPGDYLSARSGEEMRTQLGALVHDRELARATAQRGLATIERRHTCRHRVDELLEICERLGARARRVAA